MCQVNQKRETVRQGSPKTVSRRLVVVVDRRKCESR